MSNSTEKIVLRVYSDRELITMSDYEIQEQVSQVLQDILAKQALNGVFMFQRVAEEGRFEFHFSTQGKRFVLFTITLEVGKKVLELSRKEFRYYLESILDAQIMEYREKNV